MAFNGNSQNIEYAPHSISLNIFSIFSPYHFNFNISYERRFSEKLALEVGVAPIFPGDYSSSPEGTKQGSGLIIRIEPKYFISNVQEVDTTSSIFISTQFYSTYHKYKLKTAPDYGDYNNMVISNIKNYALGVVGHFGYRETGGLVFSEFSTGYGRKWVYTKNDNYYTANKTNENSQFFLHTKPGWNSEPAIGLNTKIGVNFD